ncbi:ABC transporter permease [Gimesia chilikensis]|uniref:ABC-2 family transporter protein n=1 Tax=Gimesia chilikensis TaxID=2605989 RepID=A0A517WI05_9PLAN|nr:ABC transporter permease [Gimesia chilikensis]QDU04889.1 ABC-2 family transporter protein [Gimesia chilikensis]
MSFDPIPFNWLEALKHFAFVFGSSMVLALVVCLVVGVITRGAKGFVDVFSGVLDFFVQIIHISPRRIWSLSVLTIRESLRQKILFVFIIFAVLFMFAGWFLAGAADRPDLQVQSYIDFVLKAISWLVIPIMLLLACWSLPEDIRLRTIHTVVTKPVYRIEIVMGRMLGFTVLGTAILLVMGGVGYVWINRQVPDTAKESLVSKVPIYGDISFTNREGAPAASGINVGDIWMYRSYIEGATKARAIYKFEGVDESDAIDDKLNLQASFEAFRTHKGDMEKGGILYELTFVNEDKGLRVDTSPMINKEYTENRLQIDRKLTQKKNEGEADQEVVTYDIFDDLVDKDGNLTVEVACLEAGQLLGMARPDLFIRTPDRSFMVGYSKAILGIWLPMVLVIMLGVTVSCFVKGPVAILTTFTVVMVGFMSKEYMNEILSGKMQASGAIEAWYRLLTHMNSQTELPNGPVKGIIVVVDGGIRNFLWLCQQIIPNFGIFSNMREYVIKGFDVSWSAALLPGLLTTAAYILPCLLISFYSLKLRELEAK